MSSRLIGSNTSAARAAKGAPPRIIKFTRRRTECKRAARGGRPAGPGRRSRVIHLPQRGVSGNDSRRRRPAGAIGPRIAVPADRFRRAIGGRNALRRGRNRTVLRAARSGGTGRASRGALELDAAHRRAARPSSSGGGDRLIVANHDHLSHHARRTRMGRYEREHSSAGGRADASSLETGGGAERGGFRSQRCSGLAGAAVPACLAGAGESRAPGRQGPIGRPPDGAESMRLNRREAGRSWLDLHHVKVVHTRSLVINLAVCL